MLRRWRQPTVVAPRPTPASFDATHPHGSLFYFHFSSRERAATQVVVALALARNGPLSTQNEKRSARCHCKRRRVSCPDPGRAAVVKFSFVRPNKTAFMPDVGQMPDFWFCCACVAFTDRVPVRRPSRATSVDRRRIRPTQASPPSPQFHPASGWCSNKHRRCPQRPAGARGANNQRIVN